MERDIASWELGEAAECEAGWSKCLRIECGDIQLLWSVVLRVKEC